MVKEGEHGQNVGRTRNIEPSKEAVRRIILHGDRRGSLSLLKDRLSL